MFQDVVFHSKVTERRKAKTDLGFRGTAVKVFPRRNKSLKQLLVQKPLRIIKAPQFGKSNETSKRPKSIYIKFLIRDES